MNLKGGDMILIVLLAALLPLSAGAQQHPVLRLVQTIPLPGVRGRIDHLAADTKGERLFVAALGNDTMEVLDLQSGKRVRSIGGLREPQGIAFAPDLNRIFVANGGDGKCHIYDGQSLRLIQTVGFQSDADNVRYDPAMRRIYVGYGEGALGSMDAVTGKLLSDVKLHGHPESFQLESSGPRIFVNVPTAGLIAVIDRTKNAVVATWPVERARANFPMALDEAHHRLFIGCRKPAEVLVYSTDTGRVVAAFPCVGDTDDIFYDAARSFIYVSGGGGFLSTFRQRNADHYESLGQIRTEQGARTCLFVPSMHRLYLAVPHQTKRTAEIQVYE